MMTLLLAILLAETAERDAPEPLFWVLGFVVPIAALLIGALIRPRGGGH